MVGIELKDKKTLANSKKKSLGWIFSLGWHFFLFKHFRANMIFSPTWSSLDKAIEALNVKTLCALRTSEDMPALWFRRLFFVVIFTRKKMKKEQ